MKRREYHQVAKTLMPPWTNAKAKRPSPCGTSLPASQRTSEMTVHVRVATAADEPELEVLIERSTRALLVPFLSPEQIAASLELMTIDPGAHRGRDLLRGGGGLRARRLRGLGP